GDRPWAWKGLAVPGLARAQPGVLQWPLTPTMSQDDAAAKLARRIDATRKAERFLVNAAEIVTLRQRGACELHRICAEFVSSVNRNLPEAALDLSPGTYAPEMFRDSGVNLIQIGSQGREMHLAFEASQPSGQQPRSSLSRTSWRVRFGPTTSRCSKGSRFGAS